MAKVAVLVVCLIEGASLCFRVSQYGVSCGVFISASVVLQKFPSLPSLPGGFYHKEVSDFVRCFSCISDDPGGFPFTLLRPCSTWTDPLPSPPCLPGHSASAFRYALGFHCWYFAEDFCTCIWKGYCSLIFFFVVCLSGFIFKILPPPCSILFCCLNLVSAVELKEEYHAAGPWGTAQQ